MCVTNYPLHRHPDVSDLPEDNEHSFRTYERSRTLADLTGDGLSGTELRGALDAVAFTEGRSRGGPSGGASSNRRSGR
nr:hypothetical protein GCM10020093_094220 [Planobispora longispora]